MTLSQLKYDKLPQDRVELGPRPNTYIAQPYQANDRGKMISDKRQGSQVWKSKNRFFSLTSKKQICLEFI